MSKELTFPSLASVGMSAEPLPLPTLCLLAAAAPPPLGAYVLQHTATINNVLQQLHNLLTTILA